MQAIPIKTIGDPSLCDLVDRFQRQYTYLRLSITEVCNFRCNYCLPDGYRPPSHKQRFLNLVEIKRLARTFANLGTEKIRITGGEPTLRKDFLEIVETISQTEGIHKIALTTNGYRMERDIHLWQQVGITDLNISVDSLDPRQFQLITGENKLQSILKGIDRAFELGYKKIKVNAVLMKQYTAAELDKFLAWIKHKPIQMRFIELMETGEMDNFFKTQHLSGQTVMQRLLAEGWRLQPKAVNDGPAKVLAHPDYQGEIGLIMPYEKNFCASCNRLRVSATGKLHLCLFGEEGLDLRDLLLSDEQQPQLAARLKSALQTKREHHYLHIGNSGIRNNLASIGG
ncbi:cyclic pyranopterin phosphate synthase [[Haemophilus] ducreyi]|uniref:GTP 3',8-cyclase n=2 Tax=Haemophilus ducreyi TaxID=730 RepID=MOAA_HAEDU|nr:GTP 3',8-cyclase MoaA [[Haemophilus] ducreyi]Q7VLN1.1 RecName: Full=GTP 3',8-cyclase; AltName: Full=Molybdenum cofactor biosynthesis protein A [[Haemophilus] ducreyi 35000HP]AAP96204.1 molybdenum cofactor biosynthesis protein A [[Haemophilus] ducreyi 35000HP]AKO31163.1 molybdenum cofactor biosynthesis protein A [[Haemophilus] ducreyi]AKO32610.1 molybdenum cofactor biosynthesis protein A [[Haemophilus] ducreyi]AKO34060.1 molybdenum cofactor biosynthesis protein A [[Haemophilus] ducreyi]AKO3